MVRHTVLALAALVLVTSSTGIVAGSPQSVDDIVAKHYATRGGPEKWKSLQTQKMTGTASGQGAEVGMTVYSKRPNLARQEITIEIPGQGTISMVSVFDGVKAYSSNPMSGSDALTEMGPAEAEAVRDQADWDGALLDYRAKGHTAELIGTETMGGRKAHHLRVSRKSLPTQHFYIDVETGVELKVSTEAGAGPATDAEFSDYRTVNGVQVAHLMRIFSNGTLQGELRVATVEFNVPIDAALFKVR
jgi:outer membrane lipoprotein-sorting protein